MNRRALLFFVCALALAGCARRAEPGAWFDRTEGAHRAADHLLETGDVDGARGALETALSGPAPRGTSALDERVVRQDLYYRLADLELRQNRPEDAAKLAKSGLSLGEGKDVFTANLHIVNGRALERMNDAPAASREYHDALLVTEALLDQNLGEPKTP